MISRSHHGIMSPPLKNDPTDSINLLTFASIFAERCILFSYEKLKRAWLWTNEKMTDEDGVREPKDTYISEISGRDLQLINKYCVIQGCTCNLTFTIRIPLLPRLPQFLLFSVSVATAVRIPANQLERFWLFYPMWASPATVLQTE